jgi:hypothetical protein
VIRGCLLSTASAISLLLCLATAGLWVRSYQRQTAFCFRRHQEQWRIVCQAGSVTVDNQPQVDAETDARDQLRRVRAELDQAAVEWFNGGETSRGPGPHSNVLPNLRDREKVLIRSQSNTPYFKRSIPLGVFLAAAACLSLSAAAVKAWKRWRFRAGNCCRSCGYSLTGNTSGVCPECGTPVAGKAGAA